MFPCDHHSAAQELNPQICTHCPSMQVERSIDNFDIPQYRPLHYPYHYEDRRASNNCTTRRQSQNAYVTNNCIQQFCCDSIQQPSPKKSFKLMEPHIGEFQEKTKKKKQKPKPPKKPQKTKEPLKEPMIIEEPTKSQSCPPQENPQTCRTKYSEQYFTCCSSCGASTHCSCVGEEEENDCGMQSNSSCWCKSRPKRRTSSTQCDSKDPCGELFDVIRESMEEAVKNSFLDVFGQYFSCCIDKINKLACQVERNEYLLRKVHKDMKDRMGFYDHRSTQQFEYLCDRIKTDRSSLQKQKQCFMKLSKRSKTKCRCKEQKVASSSSGESPRCPSQSQRPLPNLCNSKCGKVFGHVIKSQFRICGEEESDTNTRCNKEQSGRSCEEVVINETDLTASESPTVTLICKPVKQATKDGIHAKKKRPTPSDGSINERKN